MENPRQFQPIEPGLTGHPILEPGEAIDRSPPDVCVVLQRARLNAGYELDDIASALRIRLAHLKALEEGRFDDLPGKTYVIGFLRSYGEFLGLDKDEVVRLFKEETEAGAQQSQPHLDFPAPSKEGGMPKPWLIVLVLALAGLGYGGWHYYSTQGDVAADLVTEVSDKLNEVAGMIEQGGVTGQPSDTTTQTPDIRAGTPTESMADATPDRPSVWSWGRTSEASQEAASETPAAAPAPVADQDEIAPATTQETATPAQAEPAAEAEPAPEPAVEPVREEASVEPQPTEVVAEPEVTQQDEAVEEIEEAEVVREPEPAEQAEPVLAAEAEPTLAEDAEPAEDVGAELEEASFEEPVTEAPEEVALLDTESDGMTVEVLDDEFADEADDVEFEGGGTGSGTGSASSYAGYPSAAGADVERTERAAPGGAATVDVEAYGDTTASAGPDVGDSSWGAPSANASVGSSYDNRTRSQPLERQRQVASAGRSSSIGASDYVPQVYGGANRTARIVITATEDAWVQVQGPQNELLLTRILRAGDSYRVPDRSGLMMVTGNAGALQIRVDGQLIEPIGPVGVVRRNVSLDPNQLKGGSATAID